MKLKLCFMLVFFLVGCGNHSSDLNRTAKDFLKIEPWISKQKLIEQYGQPNAIYKEETKNSELEYLEYYLFADDESENSGSQTWGCCSVVINDGFVYGVNFHGSSEVIYPNP